MNSLPLRERDYVVRDASAESVESLCALFHSVFGKTIEPSVWRWKYQDPALLGHHNVILCDTAGAVLGHVGTFILPGVYQGRPIPVAQLCDIMLAREARGRFGPNGPYARFMQALIAQLRERIPAGLYYGFPGKRPFLLGERLGLYRGTGPISEWRLSLRTLSGVEAPRPARRLPFGFAQGKPFGPAPFGSAQGQWPFLRLSPLDFEDHRLDRLWERRVSGYRDAMLVRDRHYLSWRYARNPFHRYHLLGLYSGLRLAGWVVVRQEGELLRCIDRLIDETRLTAVLDRLARFGEGSGVRELSWWATAEQPRPPGAVEHETGLIGVVLPTSAPEFAVVRPYWQPGDADIY